MPMQNVEDGTPLETERADEMGQVPGTKLLRKKIKQVETTIMTKKALGHGTEAARLEERLKEHKKDLKTITDDYVKKVIEGALEDYAFKTPRDFWDAVQKIRDPVAYLEKARTTEHLMRGAKGELYSEDIQAPEEFSQLYVQKSHKNARIIKGKYQGNVPEFPFVTAADLPLNQELAKEEEPGTGKPVATSLDDHERMDAGILQEELEHAIKSMNKNAAPGHDGMPIEVLRAVFQAVPKVLTSVCNRAFRDGDVPEWLIFSRMKMLLKAGKPPHRLDSYRPVSVPNCLCKLLDTLMARRVDARADSVGLMTDSVVGSRAGRGPAHAWLGVTEAIKDAPNGEARVLYFDVSGAFDAPSASVILQSIDQLRPGPRLRKWIEVWLMRRSFAVRGESTYSHVKYPGQRLKAGRSGKREPGTTAVPLPDVDPDFCRGFPQGSPLSSVTFNIVMSPLIAELSKQLGSKVRTQAYVDDVACVITGASTAEVNAATKRAAAIVEAFMSARGFLLSPDKCAILTRGISRPEPIFLLGEQIKEAPTYKYLGAWLDRDFTLVEAVAQVSDKLAAVKGIQRFLMRPSAEGGGKAGGGFIGARKTVFNAFLASLILYHAPIIAIGCVDFENDPTSPVGQQIGELERQWDDLCKAVCEIPKNWNAEVARQFIGIPALRWQCKEKLIMQMEEEFRRRERVEYVTGGDVTFRKDGWFMRTLRTLRKEFGRHPDAISDSHPRLSTDHETGIDIQRFLLFDKQAAVKIRAAQRTSWTPDILALEGDVVGRARKFAKDHKVDEGFVVEREQLAFAEAVELATPGAGDQQEMHIFSDGTSEGGAAIRCPSFAGAGDSLIDRVYAYFGKWAPAGSNAVGAGPSGFSFIGEACGLEAALQHATLNQMHIPHQSTVWIHTDSNSNIQALVGDRFRCRRQETNGVLQRVARLQRERDDVKIAIVFTPGHTLFGRGNQTADAAADEVESGYRGISLMALRAEVKRKALEKSAEAAGTSKPVLMSKRAAPIVQTLTNGAGQLHIKGVAESYYNLAIGIGNAEKISDQIIRCKFCGANARPAGPSLEHLITECEKKDHEQPKKFFAERKITSLDEFWTCQPRACIEVLQKYGALDIAPQGAEDIIEWWTQRNATSAGKDTAKRKADDCRDGILQDLHDKKRQRVGDGP